MTTALITHPACLDHDMGPHHPECPDRLHAVLHALDAEEFAGFARIAADQLGVGIDNVTIVTGDTATITSGMGTFAARSAVNAGSPVHLAAIEVGKKIKDFASRIMEVSVEDLELRDGFVGVRGVPGMQKSFREIAIHAISAPGMSNLGGRVPGLEYTGYFTPEQSTYSNGTHIAEV